LLSVPFTRHITADGAIEGEVTNIAVTGTCGVPTNAVAADLNFTVVGPVAVGHLAVFPKNGAAPLASLVNYVAGQTVANNPDMVREERAEHGVCSHDDEGLAPLCPHPG
jgi:hypothetical protein